MKTVAPARSTAFSDFIRNASLHEKKRVYDEVLRRAIERQLLTLAESKRT